MKNVFLFIFLLAGLFSVQTVQAQATNATTEDWSINYYGATTIVPAGAQNIPIAIGYNCSAGISVASLTTSSCGFATNVPGAFAVPCSSLTNFVAFRGTLGGLLILCSVPSPPVYSNPIFIFN